MLVVFNANKITFSLSREERDFIHKHATIIEYLASSNVIFHYYKHSKYLSIRVANMLSNFLKRDVIVYKTREIKEDDDFETLVRSVGDVCKYLIEDIIRIERENLLNERYFAARVHHSPYRYKVGMNLRSSYISLNLKTSARMFTDGSERGIITLQ
ncbi:MAG: hypothetical protein QXL94_01575 [Candidatus Parvarchaeum sp.]